MKEKILILVKTYPTFSKKYFELVCTAGINEKGEWRRLYPIPFRELSEIEKYKKYQWIEVTLEKNISDSRKESYKVKGDIKILNHISPKNNWSHRKSLLINTPIYDKIEVIKEKAQKDNTLSLCQFKPKEIIEFQVKQVEEQWDKDILRQIKNSKNQIDLFESLNREIDLVKKLPYKFSYRFKDESNRESTLMIEDWEIGQLYWNCLKKENDKGKAVNKVREKYEKFISENDLTLFLGTTLKFHHTSKNPFLIIGLFYPKKEKNINLF